MMMRTTPLDQTLFVPFPSAKLPELDGTARKFLSRARDHPGPPGCSAKSRWPAFSCGPPNRSGSFLLAPSSTCPTHPLSRVARKFGRSEKGNSRTARLTDFLACPEDEALGCRRLNFHGVSSNVDKV